MAKIAFLGLGAMGAPMAGFLQKAGHDVTVYNRTQSKAEAWVTAYGGGLAPSPAQAAVDKDFVLACVGNDDDLRSVTTGPEGCFSSMSKGAVFIDHTTVSLSVTLELSALAQQQGLHYIDAPISGGQQGAENGALAIMCGGAPQIFEKAEPILACYAKLCRLMGPVGDGQRTKMCNQIAIAGLLQALSESLHFAQKSGLDAAAVLEVISQGAAGSWQMENRWPSMMADHYNHGFAVDWMRKDLGICLDAADQAGASLPVTALVDQFYKDVQNMGGGRWDTSSLLKKLQK